MSIKKKIAYIKLYSKLHNEPTEPCLDCSDLENINIIVKEPLSHLPICKIYNSEEIAKKCETLRSFMFFSRGNKRTLVALKRRKKIPLDMKKLVKMSLTK